MIYLFITHGHILLAMNKKLELVQEKLHEAKSWSDTLGVNEFSELGIAVSRLESALRAHVDGEEVLVGSRKEDVPSRVRTFALETIIEDQ